MKRALLVLSIITFSLNVSAVEKVSNKALVQCAYIAYLTKRLDEKLTFEYAFDLRIQADKPKLSMIDRRYIAGYETGAVSVWIGIEIKRLPKAEADTYYEDAYVKLCRDKALPYANSIIAAEAKREIDELTDKLK